MRENRGRTPQRVSSSGQAKAKHRDRGHNAESDRRGNRRLYRIPRGDNPPGSGPPRHVHYGCDELFYVLEGQFLFLVGERQVSGSPGTFVFIPRGTVHAAKVVGTSRARCLRPTYRGAKSDPSRSTVGCRARLWPRNTTLSSWDHLYSSPTCAVMGRASSPCNVARRLGFRKDRSRKPVCSELNRIPALYGDIRDLVRFDPGGQDPPAKNHGAPGSSPGPATSIF